MAGYYCKICGIEKYVDLDKEDVDEKAIKDGICMNCLESDNSQQWHDSNPVEADL